MSAIFSDIQERIRKARRSQVVKEQDLSPEVEEMQLIAQATKEDFEFEGITPPMLYQFESGQIDSSVAADTVLVTGIANKILLVYATTSYKAAGTTQAWRYEIDTGAAFATTRRISPTSTSDKETQGQIYVLESTERIVINVTTTLAASTIDWTINYVELGFGTLWS